MTPTARFTSADRANPRGCQRLLGQFMALVFVFSRGKIVGFDVVADPVRLRKLDLAAVND
jgi:hypothetical protein